MSKFQKKSNAELLGVTPLVNVQDQEIWDNLVTPLVRAHLGPIVKVGEPEFKETQEGHFPGDETSNFNNHVLSEGGKKLVRFPYLSTMHKTENGALVIKRDAVKIRVTGWVGDVMAGKGQMIFLAGLRDRRFDGTPRANDSALISFAYDDPKHHRPLNGQLRCAEISIYGYLPDSRVVDATGEPQFDEFIAQPFKFLDRPELFKQYFDRAWKTSRAPGQFAASIHDISKLCLAGFERIARAHGYDVLETAPSHYHVAMWFKSRGYRFTYSEHSDTLSRLAEGIKRVKASGVKLTRPQESWLCVLQSLRPIELIPEGLRLGQAVWPQDNIGPATLWMNKPLTDKARQLIPGPVPFES